MSKDEKQCKLFWEVTIDFPWTIIMFIQSLYKKIVVKQMKKILYMGVRGYFLPQKEYEEVRKVLNHQSSLLELKKDDNTDISQHQR